MAVDKTQFKNQELFDGYITEDGVDFSLMTGFNIQRLMLYGKIRKELSRKYPKPKKLREDKEDTINIEEARNDNDAALFIRCVDEAKEAYDRVRILQNLATQQEKIIVRFYSHLTYNWADHGKEYRKLLKDSDLYEIVESYFKILRKYGLTTTEEPYYFLSPQQKRKVKLEGEMLMRTTQMDITEINVSLLEGLT